MANEEDEGFATVIGALHIPKEEWRRGEKRAKIDGTCYVTNYNDEGEITSRYIILSKKNPLVPRAEYQPTYNAGFEQYLRERYGK